MTRPLWAAAGASDIDLIRLPAMTMEAPLTGAFPAPSINRALATIKSSAKAKGQSRQRAKPLGIKALPMLAFINYNLAALNDDCRLEQGVNAL